MNRIRAAYMELAPDLKRFMVMGTTDDERGVVLTMASAPGQSFVASLVAATPTLIGVLNAMIVAAIAVLALIQLGADTGPALIAGAASFVAGFGLWAWWTRRHVLGLVRSHRPMFPAEHPDPGQG